jgi:hypothetical protein
VALAAKFNISPGRWKHFWPVVIVLTERSGKMNRMRFAHQNYVEKSLHASQRLIAHFESLFSLKRLSGKLQRPPGRIEGRGLTRKPLIKAVEGVFSDRDCTWTLFGG